MPVRIDEHEHAAVVRLDWPAKRNALGPADARELADAILAAGERLVSAVVLTGEGGTFCAGGDLKEIAAYVRTRQPAEVRDGIYTTFQAIVAALRECPVPTVAAVNGPAVGLGMDIVLACDMRLIGPQAWLAQGWARLGLIPGTGGATMLAARAPAEYWQAIIGQHRYGQSDCARLGLGTPAGDPLDEALARAVALAPLPRQALSAYATSGRSGVLPTDADLRDCAEVQSHLLTSPGFARLAGELLRMGR
jgi:enoyl-CoA hydratase/carnithine racemase